MGMTWKPRSPRVHPSCARTAGQRINPDICRFIAGRVFSEPADRALCVIFSYFPEASFGASFRAKTGMGRAQRIPPHGPKVSYGPPKGIIRITQRHHTGHQKISFGPSEDILSEPERIFSASPTDENEASEDVFRPKRLSSAARLEVADGRKNRQVF